MQFSLGFLLKFRWASERLFQYAKTNSLQRGNGEPSAREFNFIPNDEEMFDAIDFTLARTNGKFVCSSTPWHTDRVFYHIFHDKAFQHFAKGSKLKSLI